MSHRNLHVGTVDAPGAPAEQFRYGIFVRPPAEVTLPALDLMRAARDVFGFQAALAYPPHITLIGSIVLNGSEAELVDAIGRAIAGKQPIGVHGSGLDAVIGAAVGIDYHRDRNGAVNLGLRDLYSALLEGTDMVRGFVPTDRRAEHRRANQAPDHFKAHLTVLGHDGADNLAVRDEAKKLLEAMAVTLPTDWIADTLTLYRFWSSEWSGKYWLSQEWIPLKSWCLGS